MFSFSKEHAKILKPNYQVSDLLAYKKAEE